ncbi:MAG: HAD family phosphatase [Bacteroidetes bacterium]|nr:HAD family phosphatase [Bacteroidota bacterium]
MLKGIENIILDLGGVIINLNQELTTKAFQQLFPINHNEILEKSQTQQLFEKYETNQISTAEFLQFFKAFNPFINENQIIEAWNKMLLDIPLERIDLIKNLSKKYNVFLLSNTNELHYLTIENQYQKVSKNGTFESLFKKAYLSYRIGLRKPNQEIFENLLLDAHLKPENTLFIDDSLEHINAASTLGIRTYHLDSNNNETLTTLFNEY